MRQAVIVGAGGHALEVASLLRDIDADGPGIELLGYLVDVEFSHSARVPGAEVLGGFEWLAAHPKVEVVIAVGSAKGRATVVQRLAGHGAVTYATLVHPAAHLAANASLGQGSQVLAGAAIGARARLGNHCIVNYGAAVTHECSLEDYVTLAPGASLGGRAVLRQGVEVGLNASILPGLEVGPWAVVGAGAVVHRPVGARSTVVGVPAVALPEAGRG
jgi:sugar O-acyltransferase (sialic acid O-acetyltransferase NeuD family)